MQSLEYRKMAETEDEMWYYRALHHHVTESLRVLQNVNQDVLDAGCGTGGLLRRLAKRYPEWRFHGLDFSVLACELAKERTSVDITQGSIDALPFANEVFDAVVSCDVLCQIADPVKALQEIRRCLKPDGLLVITMPAYQWMYSYHDREVANLRRYSKKQVSSMLEESDFQIVHNTYWNMLPFPLAVLRRKILPSPKSGSDVKLFPAPVETVFNGLMAFEHAWRRVGGIMPFGSSVLTVARKSSQM